MSHSHSHSHSHDDHAGHAAGRMLWLGLALTLSFAAVEAAAGLWADSLALLGDAGHMLTDSAALGIGAVAAKLATRGPTPRLSYGWKRAELVGALINVLFMYAVVALVGWSAIHRLIEPVNVDAPAVVLVGVLGLAVNILVAWLLHRGEQTLNTQGALLHVMGDLLGSLAAVAAGLIILATDWMPIDPLLSLFVCALIVFSSTRLLLNALNVVMEGVPGGMNLREIERAMRDADAAVENVHHIHVWAVSSRTIALSAHVEMADMDRWPAALTAIRRRLHDEFGIDHPTLQPEPRASAQRCRSC
ncbi:cation diffusion facilitator family transporter [uncultured Abyssibacter sp.]|uniref:cation diffusion facilitator family transporter n=1 Tax=uncultured Abyssibacter sp. TaxID=2320202 RepID=UPI0032B1FD85